MTNQEIKQLESRLHSAGYGKISERKYKPEDEYEWFKVIDYGEGRMCSIFFSFWNFDKFCKGAGWNVSVAVMPDCAGRKDLLLSADWITDIKKVEMAAEIFMDCVKRIEKI